MSALQPHLVGAGIGLRLPHLEEVVAARPSVPFFEIHPESFLANPHATELLVDIADHYPVSVHSVGVSIGSADGVDRAHLARVRALIERLNPVMVSGHLAWSTHQGEYLNDLLPLPYTEASLDVLVEHIAVVQDTLGRPYLVENPSSYVGFTASVMTESEFLAALVDRTGCRLLCDVSNIHLSAHNMGFDPRAYLDALPAHAIAEFHLGGFEVEPEAGERGATVLVDTHGTQVADGSWDLYEYAVGRLGSHPTLIERDNEIPDLAVLVAESRLALTHASNGRGRRGV